MKKTYKNPTLTVVKVQPARILAGSEQIEVSMTNYNGSTEIQSRQSRFSIWEDEEEY